MFISLRSKFSIFAFIPGLLLGALFFAQTAVAEEDFENSGTGWVYKTLDMEVTYHPEDKKLLVEGSAVLVLQADRSFGPTLALNLNGTLDLRTDIMKFISVSAGESAEVTINVSPNDDSHKNANATKLATLRFAKSFQRGDEVEVWFSLESVGEGFQFKISQTMVMASYEAGWYPVPISGPNQTESHLRRSKGTTKFNLPVGTRSFSNGKLVKQQEADGWATEVWQVSTPMARSFALGPYTVQRFDLDGKEVAVYQLPDEVRPVWTKGKVISGPEMLEGLSSAIEILEDAYGPFPYESFGIVEISNDLVNWWGSLEEGFMTATSGSLSSGKLGVLDTISHEVSHSWWGALVETGGPGAYLGSESMANFSTRYFFEKSVGTQLSNTLFRYGGDGPMDFNYSVKGYFQQLRDGKDAALSSLVSGSSNNYNLASAKGGLMYDMLGRRIGDDDLFFGVFKSLVRDFAGKTITLVDIRAAFVAAAPAEAKLEQFFVQWLDGTGAPRLEVALAEMSENQVEITITQTQGGDAYHLFLDVDVYVNGAAVRKSVEVDGQVTTLTIEIDGPVSGVTLDPDHTLLLWTPDYGPFPDGG